MQKPSTKSRGSFLCTVLVLVLGLGACGNAEHMTLTPDTAAVFMQDVVGDHVSELTINEDGQASVSFTDYTDEDEFVVVLFNQNTSNTRMAFQLDGVTDVPLLQKPDVSPLAVQKTTRRHDLTEDLHLLLRRAERHLDVQARVTPSPGAYLTTPPELGSARQFKVISSFSSTGAYSTITAELRYTDGEFDYYVDERDRDSVSDEDMAQLGQNYAAVRDSEEALFGASSDVDGNGRVEVVFTRVVNGIGLSGGGFVSGFFYAADLLSSIDYPVSNEAEVIFTFVPDPAGDLGFPISKSFAMSNVWDGVIAHEYQHMISYNQRVLLKGTDAEAPFLNEALSHLAEDIYSQDATGYMQKTGLENFARVKSYLNNIGNICFTCGTSLEQRGGSYLFLRYLYEQAQLGNLPGAASGAELINLLLQADVSGPENLAVAALGAGAAAEDLRELMGPFGVAVYLSGTAAGQDSSMTQFSGINLRAVQDDNRGTVLSGPGLAEADVLPYTDAVQGNGISYVLISGATIREAGGTLNFSFAEGSDFGGYVVSP